MLVGIGMGTAGCVMQSLLRNDMASPGTLGISSGSGLFVLLFIVIFKVDSVSSAIALPLLAFVGGMTAAVLIFYFPIEEENYITYRINFDRGSRWKWI